jgi:hypothetical protein
MIDLSRALASAFVEGTAGERFKGRKTCTDARGQDKGHRAGCRDLWLCEALARHGSPLIRKEWAAFPGIGEHSIGGAMRAVGTAWKSADSFTESAAFRA